MNSVSSGTTGFTLGFEGCPIFSFLCIVLLINICPFSIGNCITCLPLTLTVSAYLCSFFKRDRLKMQTRNYVFPSYIINLHFKHDYKTNRTSKWYHQQNPDYNQLLGTFKRSILLPCGTTTYCYTCIVVWRFRCYRYRWWKASDKSSILVQHDTFQWK